MTDFFRDMARNSEITETLEQTLFYDEIDIELKHTEYCNLNERGACIFSDEYGKFDVKYFLKTIFGIYGFYYDFLEDTLDDSRFSFDSNSDEDETLSITLLYVLREGTLGEQTRKSLIEKVNLKLKEECPIHYFNISETYNLQENLIITEKMLLEYANKSDTPNAGFIKNNFAKLLFSYCYIKLGKYYFYIFDLA
jgi:hypothetical protein